jgi:ribosomal protein S18 acetylase RimI-like enzyme
VFTYLIAWEGTQPVGHVGIDWPDDRQPELDLEQGFGAYVHDLEVVPERRNHGVGRALMLELEKRVRGRGLTRIVLSTGLDDGFAAARHLYRSLGYVQIPETTHIDSYRVPSDPTPSVIVESLTYWARILTST